MTRADEIKAKAARLKEHHATTPPASTSVPTDLSTSVPTDVGSLRPVVRSKPVRLTVDISPADHAALGQLALSAAATIGAARVPGQDIMRALLRHYLADPDLQHTILTDLATHRNTR
jgi:hypothetical protein